MFLLSVKLEWRSPLSQVMGGRFIYFWWIALHAVGLGGHRSWRNSQWIFIFIFILKPHPISGMSKGIITWHWTISRYGYDVFLAHLTYRVTATNSACHAQIYTNCFWPALSNVSIPIELSPLRYLSQGQKMIKLSFLRALVPLQRLSKITRKICLLPLRKRVMLRAMPTFWG